MGIRALAYAWQHMQAEAPELPAAVFAAGLSHTQDTVATAVSFGERFEYRHLNNLSSDDAAMALTAPAQDAGVGWQPSALESVLRDTQGYPYFIQEFGDKIQTMIAAGNAPDTFWMDPNSIWMDWCNENSRCTQNVVVGTRTKWHGALFIEASSRPNLLDHNVLWDSSANGIYEHDGSNQFIVHNLIGRSARAAILLNGKVTDRLTYGRPIVPGGHTVANNLFVANATNRVAEGQNAGKSLVAANLAHGTTASLNRRNLSLTWGLLARVPACTLVPAATHDFFGRPRDPRRLVPGPFATLPNGLRTELLWPPKNP